MNALARTVAALALALAAGCAPAPRTEVRTEGAASFLMPPANRGVERYSAWFADSDGKVVYFGLSAFWEASWSRGGEATAELAEPGDHLIGRFELASEAFLEPLRVRGLETGARSSVWDVLAHSSGRICYTTYFEQLGCIDPDGSDAQVFEGVGAGFNELYEGPGGLIYATRYASEPGSPSGSTYGAVSVLTLAGELLREHAFPRVEGVHTAPKSVAVDPATGEIWLNTDTFRADASVYPETIRLARDGTLLERRAGPPVLQFVSFDERGRGWLAEAADGRLRLRVMRRGDELARADLGPQRRVDFVQDIHFAPDGRAVLAAWSGRAWVARLDERGLEIGQTRLPRRADCRQPGGPELVYSAFVHDARVYATAHCGGRILRAASPLGPARGRPRAPR